jgi:hypothetical protein
MLHNFFATYSLVSLNLWKDFTTSHTSKLRKGGMGQQVNGVD